MKLCGIIGALLLCYAIVAAIVCDGDTGVTVTIVAATESELESLLGGEGCWILADMAGCTGEPDLEVSCDGCDPPDANGDRKCKGDVEIRYNFDDWSVAAASAGPGEDGKTNASIDQGSGLGGDPSNQGFWCISSFYCNKNCTVVFGEPKCAVDPLRRTVHPGDYMRVDEIDGAACKGEGHTSIVRPGPVVAYLSYH